MTLRFLFKDKTLKSLEFKLHKHHLVWKKLAQKWLSPQFTHREEYIGQMFHEHVLYSIVFFLENIVPIHASALVSPDDEKVILIGGTGGVGKTSSEIELCFNRGYGFMADDFAFVSHDGNCFSNLSYPKIYGYNLVENDAFSEKVLGKESFFERLHWEIHKTIGLDKVRRRVSPDVLYKSYFATHKIVKKYIILVKTHGVKLVAKSISVDHAVDMTITILKCELMEVLNQLRWYELNCMYMGEKPVITIDQLIEKWKKTLVAAFERVSLEVVYIPKEMAHADFKMKFANYIETGEVDDF